jgi:hypothetical protein
MAYQGNDASRIVVGADGNVFVGTTSATAPTDATTSLNPAPPHDAGPTDWVQLGFVSENGVQVTPSQTVTPIMAWQSAYSVRRIITARGLELDFILREFNAESIPFAFGGGSLVEAVGEKFTYTPPTPSEIDERSMCVDWADGSRAYRLYVPLGQVTDLSQFTLSRTAPAELPVKFALNHSGSGAPWTLFSDDTGLEGS